ncbi:MAG: hypothetical protein ACKVVP_11800, partial [Chloroflexota bacterium]
LPPLIAIETMVPRLLTEDRALAERVSLRSGELPLESDEPPAAQQALPEPAAQSPDAETDLIDIALSLARESAQTPPSGPATMLGAVPSWSELGRLLGTVIPKSWRASTEEFEEPPASPPRRKHDDAHSSMQQGEPPDERASSGERRDTAAGRDRADSGLSARQIQGRPRPTFHRICEPWDEALPEGYLPAVAWLLTRQAESLSAMAFRGELLQLSGRVDLDAATAAQFVQCWQMEMDQAARIRRLSAELDPALDAHVMAHRGVLALSRSRERALSWPALLVRSLLLYRHSASLAYEWINSSYLPCRRDAEPVWRLAISEAQHTFGLLRALCQLPEGHALAWEALGECRSEISELFPSTQPEWQCQLIRWGLRRRFDSEMRDEYAAELVALLGSIGLCFPGFDPESKGS